MSIHINGINLPKRREEVYLLAVDSDGRVYNWRSEELPDCKALEVPPHGRLIDADLLMEEAKRISGPITGDGWDNYGVYGLIERQPTVIEAEE